MEEDDDAKERDKNNIGESGGTLRNIALNGREGEGVATRKRDVGGGRPSNSDMEIVINRLYYGKFDV